MFFDVGASYGLHSLRLLAHGIRVVSFEPNPRCHAFFTECCRANGLTPCIEPLAVGEFCGSVNFAAPGDRTWHGSTLPEVWESWRGSAIDRWSVPQVSLDTYVAEQGPVPDLIKIDVEGSEDAVLRGAIGLLTAMAMRLRGLEVTCASLRPAPYLNSDLIEALGAAYVSTQEMSLKEAAAVNSPFDIIVEATGFSPRYDEVQTLHRFRDVSALR